MVAVGGEGSFFFSDLATDKLSILQKMLEFMQATLIKLSAPFLKTRKKERDLVERSLDSVGVE